MDKFERLKKLKNILDEGLITQDEYDTEKRMLMKDGEADIIPDLNVGNDLSKTKKIRIGSRKDIWYASFLAMVLLTVAFFSTDGFKKLQTEKISKRTLPIVNVYFQVEEVFPVYLVYLKNSKQGLLDMTITNTDNVGKNIEISYGFSEFGGLENKSVRIESDSVKKIQLTPFSTKMLDLHAPINTPLIVKVTDEQNTTLYSQSWSIKVNPGDEIPWKIKNRDCTDLIASWVTPRDRFIQELVRKTKDKTGDQTTLHGKMTDDEFKKLVKDLFNTVKDEGISFNNNPINFGEGSAQRIRLPKLTLKTKSANSIDGSVLMASLFENVGLRAYIIILSDHAIVGVSRTDQENDRIYIETTILGRSTLESILSFETAFTAATKAGKESYNKAYSNGVNQEGGKFIVIDVHKARQQGVLPLY